MTQVKFHKIFNFLLSEHEFCYTEVYYALLLMSEIIMNVKESVHDTQTILIHVWLVSQDVWN